MCKVDDLAGHRVHEIIGVHEGLHSMHHRGPRSGLSIFGLIDSEYGRTDGGCARPPGEQAGARAWHWVHTLPSQAADRLDGRANAMHETVRKIAAGSVDRKMARGRNQVLIAHHLGDVFISAEAMVNQ